MGEVVVFKFSMVLVRTREGVAQGVRLLRRTLWGEGLHLDLWVSLLASIIIA